MDCGISKWRIQDRIRTEHKLYDRFERTKHKEWNKYNTVQIEWAEQSDMGI